MLCYVTDPGPPKLKILRVPPQLELAPSLHLDIFNENTLMSNVPPVCLLLSYFTDSLQNK